MVCGRHSTVYGGNPSSFGQRARTQNHNFFNAQAPNSTFPSVISLHVSSGPHIDTCVCTHQSIIRSMADGRDQLCRVRAIQTISSDGRSFGMGRNAGFASQFFLCQVWVGLAYHLIRFLDEMVTFQISRNLFPYKFSGHLVREFSRRSRQPSPRYFHGATIYCFHSCAQRRCR